MPGKENVKKMRKKVDDMGNDVMDTDVMGTEEMGTDVIGTNEMGTNDMGTDVMGTDHMGTDEMGTESSIVTNNHTFKVSQSSFRQYIKPVSYHLVDNIPSFINVFLYPG